MDCLRNNQEMTDPFHLERFVRAQASVHSTALQELNTGCKRTHWMWFIFPQLAGLGQSETSWQYGIGGAGEARAYLAHPVLGLRLYECAEALLAVEGRTAFEIFGFPDELKLKSSMTLFASVAGPDSVFEQVLKTYFAGERDSRTLSMLDASA
jgi:uncharacterized protein (DUF1810 family)